MKVGISMKNLFDFEFERVCLGILCVLVLVCTVQIHQIKTQIPNEEETLWSKVCGIVPRKIELLKQVSCSDNAMIILKEKGYKDRINAPVVVTKYYLWGESETSVNGYSANSDKNIKFYVNAMVTSLYKEKIDVDELVKMKLVYDNKYSFDCFSARLNSEKNNFETSTKLMPLQNQDMYFIAEIPKEFTKDTKPLYLEVKIGDNKYKMNLK